MGNPSLLDKPAVEHWRGGYRRTAAVERRRSGIPPENCAGPLGSHLDGSGFCFFPSQGADRRLVGRRAGGKGNSALRGGGKILGPEEPLPRQWLVAGTTGYDFLSSMNGLFVDRIGLRELVKLYGRFIDQRPSYDDIVH